MRFVEAFLRCSGTAGCGPSLFAMMSLALQRALADMYDFGAFAKYVAQWARFIWKENKLPRTL